MSFSIEHRILYTYLHTHSTFYFTQLILNLIIPIIVYMFQNCSSSPLLYALPGIGVSVFTGMDYQTGPLHWTTGVVVIRGSLCPPYGFMLCDMIRVHRCERYDDNRDY